MKNLISERIEAYRSEMLSKGIDAAIIPQTDPHQSEYIADHWQVRRYLSGFTGSAGTLVITAKEALLWTDSRYFLQAAEQLDATPVMLMKDGLASTPSIEAYLVDHLKEGDTVGFDGMLFSASQATKLTLVLEMHGLKVVTDFDIIDLLWQDRPSLPKCKVFVHEEKFAGESASSKLRRVLEDANKQMADALFVSALDEIAWALNIRSNDVKYNPVATSYLYVSPQGSTLFMDSDKLDSYTTAYLKTQGVSVLPYEGVKDFITNLPADVKVLVEAGKTSVTLLNLLGDRAVKGASSIAVPKGCRNDVQIAGFRDAMVRDGVALVKAIMALEQAMANGETVTELDVDALLLKYRSQQDKFFDESFGSIVGYGPHGAIVHYEPTPESNATLESKGLLLIDSGAQYIDGTTDITRTIALGEPTDDEKRDFTLVTKGHIALARATFPVGTRGAQLDVLARQFLWANGLSYLHGTGHGVGHFLNVHEGPQTIRLNDTPTPLMVGMVTSNEPGLYRENIHGIRTENLMLTVPAMTTEFGEFLKFETITLFPLDLKLFMTEIMSQEEIDWVNAYHTKVRESLSPYLSTQERAWLEAKTQPLSK